MLEKAKIKVLEAIRAAHGGRLLSEYIVEAARDPDRWIAETGIIEFNELPAEFQWDDTIAAQEYRIIQAQRLIRSVPIERVDEERVIRAVYYVHDPTLPANEPGYVPLTAVSRKKAEAVTTLTQELSRIEGAVRRARDMAAFMDLSKDFENLLREVILIKRKL